MKTFEQYFNEGSSKVKTIVIKCNDQDNTLEDLLNYIKTNGNCGHSFSIVVDPKSPSMKTFGWDGDGSDSIKSINCEETA